jgi:hypothetical protein
MAKTNSALVTDLFQTFLQRQPESSELNFYTQRLDSGLFTRAGVAYAVLGMPANGTAAAEVARLYLAAFNRIPDADGLDFWLTVHRNGATDSQIADIFTRSAEFETKYGPNVSTSDFIDLLYNNVLGRTADAGGKQYWINFLNHGMTRGDVVNSFAQSAEHQSKTASKVLTTLAYTAMADRVPTDAELAATPESLEQILLKASEAAGAPPAVTSKPAIAYSNAIFSESQNNDGTIANTLTLTLTGDTFKGSPGAAIGKVTNVPTGLTAILAKTSDTTALLSLTGTAKAHAGANSISNLTVTLDNTAFTSGKASEIAGTIKSDIKVGFFDVPIQESSGVLTATGALTASLSVDLVTDKLSLGAVPVSLVSGSMAQVKDVDFAELKPVPSTGSGAGATTPTLTISIKGDERANAITASGYATTIDGGTGADTITCGSGKDTIVFASSAANNGADIIKGFAIGKGGDVMNLSAFLNKTGVTNLTALNLALSPTSVRTWNNGDVVVMQGNNVDATSIAATLNNPLVFNAPKAGKAVVISTDIIGDANIWYVVNQTDTGVIASSEITLVGTLKDVNNLTLLGFDASNFA